MTEEVAIPFAGTTASFFKDAESLRAESIQMIEEAARGVASDDRVTCRWCLNKFDVTQQQRSNSERGYLRTNLKMADYGRELVCCEACWQGAIGARTLIMGRVVPGNPESVDNPLLRAFGA